MTVSAIYVLGPTGKVIISRDYRGDVTDSAVERYSCNVVGKIIRFAVMLREKEDTELKPVTTEGDITYIYVMVQIGKVVWFEEWKSVPTGSDEAKCKCHNGNGVP